MQRTSQRASHRQLILVVFILLLAIGVSLEYRYFTSPVAREAQSSDIREWIVSGGPGVEVIPAIDAPVFESVGAADQYLDDAGYGIAVASNGRTRFYPFQLLVWHLLVNDQFQDRTLLISYDPLTFTPRVYERGTQTFGVSGQLYNSNTLMIDRDTQSLWTQSTGEAVVGEKTGSTLNAYPSERLSWSSFKKRHPLGVVLSRETGFQRDYTRNPYDTYETNHALWFPLRQKDDRYDPKTIVYGIHDGKDKAFFLEAIEEQGMIHDQIGETSVVLVYDAKDGRVQAFRRQVGAQELTFDRTEQVLIDNQTRTRWNLDGAAVAGTLRGSQLIPIPLSLSYWFSWYAMHPETDVFTN